MINKNALNYPRPGFTWKCVAVFIAMMCVNHSARAFSVGITVKGKVFAPPCIINGKRDIPIDFGSDIIIGRIDSQIYEKPIPYVLDCSAATSNALKMQLRGTGASFDGTLLSTSKSNLGIMLKSDGGKLTLNSWKNFTNPARPALSAMLVKNGSGTVTGGNFTATSTLLVEYQ